jgi:3D (Asp-Asp-Asp) domain-containing protein
MTTNLLSLVVTAYVATGHLTSGGHVPRVGITAASGSNIPLRSTVIIPGIGRRIVDDRMNRRFNGTRLDIFVASKAEAIQWGRRRLVITIIKP